MKKDKKIFSIFVISFLLVLFGVFVFLEYTNKNNKNVFVIGKKTIDVSVIDKYVNASFIALKDGKYGIMNVSGDILVDFIYDDIYKQEDYDDNFILVKDGTNYVFNGMGMELLNSSDKILTYNDMINRKTYYIKKNGNKEELFNEEGARLVDIKSNGLFYIVDDYAVYEKKLVNINNGEIMIANNIVLINDKYLLLYMDKEYRLYDIENNKWNFYNEMNSDKYYYEFISSDTKFIINIYGEILTENEKDVEKINDKYSISYDICKEGFNVYSNGDKISEDCYNTYKYFKNKNIIILSKSDSDDFIYNDELISYDGKINIVGNVIRVYDGLKSRYYDLENNDINIKCSKSLEATLDGYVCNNYDSAYFMNNKLEKISDDYSSISCNKDSFCLVLKNQKYGLYYKNKELIEPNYYDIKVYDNYVIADNLFAVDVYKLGNGIPLSLSEKKYSEATLYEIINVSDVIKEYDLFEIEDYIYENESMFKKYAYVVLNNKKVTGFRREILMMFKVVALNKENYDEYYFLNSLEKLKVVQGERQDKLTVGLYDDSNLLIEVLVNNKMVLYHELLHFINNRINYKEHFKVCEYDGKYYSYNNLDTLTINEQNKCKNVEVKDNMLMLDEAGTEVNTANYMTGKMDSYLSGTLVYQVLSYIYGVDTLNNIYFSKDRNFEFFNLLSSEALTLLEYNEFLDSINAITNFGKDATNKDINNALKYLIKIYISEKGSNWYEDFVFRYCLNGISQGYIIEPSIVEFQDIRRGVMTYDIFKMINKPEYSNWISPGTILFKDDKVYFNIYVIRNSSGNDVKGLLTALFDVNKKKISSYTFSAV